MGFVPPENPGHEDARIHPGEDHRRTLRRARSTRVAACLAECRPAGAWANSRLTSAGDGALTGLISRPASPRSNTLRGPPRSNPSRRHHSSGNTVCRLEVRVIVVTFISVILCYHDPPVNSLPWGVESGEALGVRGIPALWLGQTILQFHSARNPVDASLRFSALSILQMRPVAPPRCERTKETLT